MAKRENVFSFMPTLCTPYRNAINRNLNKNPFIHWVLARSGGAFLLY
jgi:hypothetical protein